MLENLHTKIGNFKKTFKKIKKIESELNDAIETSTLSEIDKTSLAVAIKEFTAEYEENVNAFTTKDT